MGGSGVLGEDGNLTGGMMPSPGVGPAVEGAYPPGPVAVMPREGDARAVSRVPSRKKSDRGSEKSSDKGSEKGSEEGSDKSSVASSKRSSKAKSEKRSQAPSEVGSRRAPSRPRRRRSERLRTDLRPERQRYRARDWEDEYPSDEYSDGGGVIGAIRRHPGKPRSIDARELHERRVYRDDRGHVKYQNLNTEQGTGVRSKATMPGPIRRAMSRSRTRDQTRTRSRSRTRPPPPRRRDYSPPKRYESPPPRRTRGSPHHKSKSPPLKPRNSPPPKPVSPPPKPREESRGRRRGRSDSQRRGPVGRSVSVFAESGTGIKPKSNLNHKLFSREPLYKKSGRQAVVSPTHSELHF